MPRSPLTACMECRGHIPHHPIPLHRPTLWVWCMLIKACMMQTTAWIYAPLPQARTLIHAPAATRPTFASMPRPEQGDGGEGFDLA